MEAPISLRLGIYSTDIMRRGFDETSGQKLRAVVPLPRCEYMFEKWHACVAISIESHNIEMTHFGTNRHLSMVSRIDF